MEHLEAPADPQHKVLTTVLCCAQVMVPLLRPGTDTTLLSNTEDNLHAFSVKGLRTLVVGSKVRPQLRTLSLRTRMVDSHVSSS
jgi:hypothetical protein